MTQLIAQSLKPASWIWPTSDNAQPNTYALFRGSFNVKTPDQKITLLISGSSRHRVYINGQLLPDGPPPSTSDMQYVDEHDLTGYLKQGHNLLAVIVHMVGRQGGERGGLLAQITDAQGRTLLATQDDTSWQCMISDAWYAKTYVMIMNWFDCYQEMFDARKLDADWVLPDFQTDATWHEPVALTHGPDVRKEDSRTPWRLLLKRPIPFMKHTQLLPQSVAYVEQCTAAQNRNRQEDLSIALSAPGRREITNVRIDDVDNLCQGDQACVVQGSTDHIENYWAHAIHEPAFVLDFGQVVNGCLELDLKGEPGTVVTIGFTEDLLDGHFNNSIEVQSCCRYTLGAGRQRWMMFSWRAMRYVKIRVQHADIPLTFHRIALRREQYPFAPIGAFHSSRPLHNQVHEICQNTLDLCTHESLVDTPWREQGQWLGDVSAVILGGIYACYGDVQMPEKFLRQAALTQTGKQSLLANLGNATPYDKKAGIGNPITDYSLWWIQALWEHYQFTGDIAILQDMHAIAHGIFEHCKGFCDPATGLIGPMPNWIFIDWANVDKQGTMATLNTIFAGALQALVQIHQALGNAAESQTVNAHLQQLKEHFAATFWDDQYQCLIDAIHEDGTPSDRITEHANAAAILWDLVDDKQAQQIIANVFESDRLHPVLAQPFFCSVVLRAFGKMRRWDLAIELIESRWGKQMIDHGFKSTLEEWHAIGTWRSGKMHGMRRSQSHAWSAYPSEFFICDLVRFEILQPGCREVALQTPDVDFDFSATIPTPMGSIQLEYTQGRLSFQTPAGMTLHLDDRSVC